MLAGGERREHALGPPPGGGGVEIKRDRRVGERGVAVDAPLEAAAALGKRREFFRVAAEQNRLRHQPVAARELQPALRAHLQQRPQMLRCPEPAGRAVDDYADWAGGHLLLSDMAVSARRLIAC